MKHTLKMWAYLVAAKFLIHKGSALLKVLIEASLLAVYNWEYLERLLLTFNISN